MLPLIVVRPEPGCTATLAAARERGLAAQGFPLFEVRPLAWDLPDPAEFDAVLVGSANALRHAGPGLARLRGLPAYAVGAATAEACTAAGLSVAAVGSGGLQGVLDAVVPEHRRLLRLAGAERIALVPPPGVTLDERLIYASEPQAMPAALAAALTRPSVVMLHSAEAARHFAAECERLGLARACHRLACIGARVVAAAGPGWGAARAAEIPAETPLLALAAAMCQEAAGS